MGYAIGVLVAVLVSGFGRVVGLDRGRAFYPTVLVVVALYYVLFAVMGGSTRALTLELVGMSVFALLAAIGFRRSWWVVSIGLAAHGVFDFFHASIVTNPGVPDFWPAFCAGYDIAAAGVVAFLKEPAR